VDREQVIAYRGAAHGLHRAAEPTGLRVLDLGVQDTPPGSARLALAARLAEPPPPDPTADGGRALVWSHRGAPHLHRTADLPAVAASGWPRSDADAAARLGWQRARLAAVGMAARAAYVEVADAVRDVAGGELADGPITKGALSAAVTARIAPELSPWCRPCNCHHVSEQLLRLTALPAGVRLDFDSKPLTFSPIPRWRRPAGSPAATAELVRTYLRFFGPATIKEAAAFLGTSVTEARPSWPDGLVEVDVDGRAGWLPAGALGALRGAPSPRFVRLLPPSDPYLQARDRTLIVPERSRHKELWAVLGSPGAVLVDGEVAGVWRAKRAGRDRLELTVRPFRPLTGGERAELDDEAERVGAVRGARVSVRVSD
jgi:hypothetical protein